MTYAVYAKLRPGSEGDEDASTPGADVAPLGTCGTLDEATALAIFHAGFSLADSLRMKGLTFAEISQNEEVNEARRQDKRFAIQDNGTWVATIGGFSYVIWKEAEAASMPARAS